MEISQQLDHFIQYSHENQELIEEIIQLNDYEIYNKLDLEKHSKSTVNQFRNQLDEVLNYYSLLFYGAISGDFPLDLNENIIENIKLFTSRTSVKEHFETYHPNTMATVLEAYYVVVQNNEVERYYPSPPTQLNLFNNFLSIIYSIDFDKNIPAFISFLNDDDTITYQNNRIKLITQFSDESHFKSLFTDNVPGTELALGALAFMDYIKNMKELLDNTEIHPIIKSSLWNYGGFFIEEKQNRLVDLFSELVSHLKDRSNDPSLAPNIEKLDLGTEEDFQFNEAFFINCFNQDLIAIENFITDQQLSLPIKKLSNDILIPEMA